MTVHREFEQLLKNSHHFSDALNTHRRATATIIASLITAMEAKDRDSAMKVLKRLEEPLGSISDDTSRRLLCALICDALKLK